MPYVLGVHLGATTTSAAVARRENGRWGAAAPLPLGSRSATVPTALLRSPDGAFVAGDALLRHVEDDPDRVARAFTRHVGEDAPLLVGHEFIPAHVLAAHMVEWVVGAAAHRQGQPAEHIVVAHSGAWGPYRAQLVRRALARIRLADVTLLPEPVAVGLDYARNRQLDDEALIAVCGVGGSSFDATVLRRSPPGFTVVGDPLYTGHPNGQDLDDAVFEYLRAVSGWEPEPAELSDPRARHAVAQLRGQCALARETLSYQQQVVLPSLPPWAGGQVELARARFEQLVRDHLEWAPDLLQQALRSASVEPEQLEAVVLAGGCARTPLLQNLISERVRQSVLVDRAPELVAARGAAGYAVEVVSTELTPERPGSETELLSRIEGPVVDSVDGAPDEDPVEGPRPAPRPPLEIDPMPVEEPRGSSRAVRIAKLAAAVVLIVAGLIMTYLHYQPGGGVGSLFG